MPAAGTPVMFDRRWFNRVGVERVTRFCTNEDVDAFLRSVLAFSRAHARPLKPCKRSPMDAERRARNLRIGLEGAG
jgi:hypothetical protein